MPTPDYVETYAGQINRTLEEVLPPATGPNQTLAAAMQYAVMGGGKRLRPITALATCEACGGRPADIFKPAAALELIHVYPFNLMYATTGGRLYDEIQYAFM